MAAGKGALAAQVHVGHALQSHRPFFRGVLVVAATVAGQEGYGLGRAHLLSHTLPELGLDPALTVLGDPTGLDLQLRSGGRAAVLTTFTSTDADSVQSAANRAARHVAEGMVAGADFEVLRISVPEVLPASGPGVQARLRVECRIAPERSVTGCLDWVAGRILHSGDEVPFRVELVRDRRKLITGRITEVLYRQEPWSTDPGEPFVRRACSALQSAGWETGRFRDGSVAGSSKGTPAGDVGVRRSPALGLGPGDALQCGAPDESVTVESLSRALLGYVALADAVLDAPGQVRFATAGFSRLAR
jgi:acetylornithine deacetylase/succinyl-diaminopimelate desuccinylase-like protein